MTSRRKVTICLLASLSMTILSKTPHAKDVPPAARLSFHVDPNDFGELRQIIMRFAEKEGFSFTDNGAALPTHFGRKTFNFVLKLRSDQSIELNVDDFGEPSQMFVFIYVLKPNNVTKEIALRFEKVLRDRWPDLATYSGP